MKKRQSSSAAASCRRMIEAKTQAKAGYGRIAGRWWAQPRQRPAILHMAVTGGRKRGRSSYLGSILL
ncbi:MAG: hypothetical protein ACLPTZ_08590 [Beijerinckiaceae bacterium]